MARSRNIKPGFFTNDVLGELPALTRLLFAGLWTIADREGRIEDRPKKIRAEVMPYDLFDADEHLTYLERAGFINRYEADGIKVIQVLSWAKHQNPHVKEAPSSLPEQCKHQTSTVQEPDKEQPLPERAGLIPSSLIPDSLISDSLNKHLPVLPEEDRHEEAEIVESSKAEKVARIGFPDCPHVEILALWAEILPTLPQHIPERWRGGKADHLRTRWRETAVEKGWKTQAEGLAHMRRFFIFISQSDFLMGRVPPREGRRLFQLELSWLVVLSHWDTVIEGKYHQEAATA